jgi:hypothetical protein
MTKLSGEFETDLALPEALAACAEAIDGLGWRIESVEGHRIVSYAHTGATADPPRIEVLASESIHATELRIIGTDRDADQLQSGELIAALDRVRDAIEASIESVEGVGQRRSRFASVPLFSERPVGLQVITGAVVPAAFGAVAGIVRGVSAAGYWAIQAVALIGAVLAGLEHLSGREGALRGLVGGTLYGAFILIAHAAAGSDPEVKLPDFAPVLVVFTALFGVLASGLGGWLRDRSLRPAV